MDYQNKGLISLHQATGSSGPSDTRTLIVTGVARSGTSMVARVLHGAGVFMGEHLDDVVFEDQELGALFAQPTFDPDRLRDLVRQRDRVHSVWGFKRPQLRMQGPNGIDLFRNPSVVVMVRDPVAVAERYAIAEHLALSHSLSVAMKDLQQMMQFAETITCPVLLVSYEKATRQPDRFIARLLDFCGLDLSPAEQEGLLPLVEPDRPAYIETARRVLAGYIDCIDDTTLVGWAHQFGLAEPLTVNVLRDGTPIADCVADQYRGDLAASGIGSGRHGFTLDLSRLRFTRNSRVSVIIAGRSFVLNNSGATVAELGANVHRIEQHTVDPWNAMSIGLI